jgi:hypothetical protein
MGLFKKKVVVPKITEGMDVGGDAAIARTVVEVPAKHRLDYLRKTCTFIIRSAKVDEENCDVNFSCEQDIPWSKYKKEAWLSINLPPEYIHMVHADIKSGVRVRMTIEPILEDDPSGVERQD